MIATHRNPNRKNGLRGDHIEITSGPYKGRKAEVLDSEPCGSWGRKLIIKPDNAGRLGWPAFILPGEKYNVLIDESPRNGDTL